jgi:hypothetical protein
VLRHGKQREADHEGPATLILRESHVPEPLCGAAKLAVYSMKHATAVRRAAFFRLKPCMPWMKRGSGID